MPKTELNLTIILLPSLCKVTGTAKDTQLHSEQCVLFPVFCWKYAPVNKTTKFCRLKSKTSHSHSSYRNRSCSTHCLQCHKCQNYRYYCFFVEGTHCDVFTAAALNCHCCHSCLCGTGWTGSAGWTGPSCGCHCAHLKCKICFVNDWRLLSDGWVFIERQTHSHIQDGGILMCLSADLIPPASRQISASMRSLNLNARKTHFSMTDLIFFVSFQCYSGTLPPS